MRICDVLTRLMLLPQLEPISPMTGASIVNVWWYQIETRAVGTVVVPPPVKATGRSGHVMEMAPAGTTELT